MGSVETEESELQKRIQGINLNTEILDSLVVEHLKGKPRGVVDGEAAKLKVIEGDIAGAICLAEESCPDIFEDQRLLFKLKQQQFLECLRPGTPESQIEALNLLRNELNPLALDSYLEAYAELKQCLLTLLLNQDCPETVVTHLWSESARASLAGKLARTVRQYHGQPGSKLSLILRYLQLINISFCKSKVLKDAEATASQLAEANAEGREPPPTPPENYALEDNVIDAVSNVSSRYIVSLKNALGISRSEVVDSLKVAGGSLDAALKNELAALPSNGHQISKWAAGYATVRGLERQPARKEASTLESNSHQPTGRDRDSSLSPPKKIARRMHSEPEKSDSLEDAMMPINPSKIRPEAASWQTEDFQRLRTVTEAGMLDEALTEVERKAPYFWSENPDVHFEFLAAKFQQLLDSGKTFDALSLVQSKLTPISNEHEALQPRLKSVVSRLVPGSGVDGCTSFTSLASLLEKELRSWLGLAEPTLVKILQVLLLGHRDWFERQQCSDCLAPLLGIDKLQNPSDVPCKGNPVRPELCPQQAQEAAPEETTRLEDLASTLDEELVSDMMDITDLGRAEIIRMLRDFDGDHVMLLEHHFMNHDQ